LGAQALLPLGHFRETPVVGGRVPETLDPGVVRLVDARDDVVLLDLGRRPRLEPAKAQLLGLRLLRSLAEVRRALPVDAFFGGEAVLLQRDARELIADGRD